jgi:hypothetical protein
MFERRQIKRDLTGLFGAGNFPPPIWRISAEYNISDFGFLKATTNGVFWPKKVKQKIVLRGNFSYDSGIENGTARRPSTVQFFYA